MIVGTLDWSGFVFDHHFSAVIRYAIKQSSTHVHHSILEDVFVLERASFERQRYLLGPIFSSKAYLENELHWLIQEARDLYS